MRIATVASGIIGSVTFFGSYVAFGKLAEFICVKWKLHPWQKVIKYGFSLAVTAGAVWHGLTEGAGEVGLLHILFMVSGAAIGGLLLMKKDRFPGMNAVKLLPHLLHRHSLAIVVGNKPEHHIPTFQPISAHKGAQRVAGRGHAVELHWVCGDPPTALLAY